MDAVFNALYRGLTVAVMIFPSEQDELTQAETEEMTQLSMIAGAYIALALQNAAFVADTHEVVEIMNRLPYDLAAENAAWDARQFPPLLDMIERFEREQNDMLISDAVRDKELSCESSLR